MPILECRCRSCGKPFEYLSLSSADAPACPACGSREAMRLLSTFAVSAGGAAAEAACDAAGTGCGGDPATCGRCGPSAFADA